MVDKTFIINLPSCTERLNLVRKQIEDVNIDYEIFPAVDGSNAEDISKYLFSTANWHDPNNNKAITMGEVGCALSHYEIWKRIIESVESGELTEKCRVMILEDDVEFLPNFHSNLAMVLTELSDNFDLLYLNRKAVDPDIRTTSITTVEPGFSYWTCAYILTYRGAKILTSTNYINNLIPVDEYLPIMYGCKRSIHYQLYESATKLTCRACNPSLLKLSENAFQNSTTFNSEPFVVSRKPYTFKNSLTDETNVFVCIYINSGNNYDARFKSYCEIYGVDFHTDTKIIQELVDSGYSLGQIIVLYIDATSSNHKYLLCSSPNKIITQYLYECDDQQIVGADPNCVITTAQELTEYDLKIPANVIASKKQHLICTINEDTVINFNYNQTATVCGNEVCIFVSDSDYLNNKLNQVENYTGNGWSQYYGMNLKTIPVTNQTIYAVILSDTEFDVHNTMSVLSYDHNLIHWHVEKTRDSDITPILQQHRKTFLDSSYDYFLFIDNNVIVTNRDLLTQCVGYDRDVVVPMLDPPVYNSRLSNYWTAISVDDWYLEGFDYDQILNRNRRGLFNVPFGRNIWLVKRNVLEHDVFGENMDLDFDRRFCRNLRQHNIFIYLSNVESNAYMGNFEIIQPSELDKITIFDIINESLLELWERKYLHADFVRALKNRDLTTYTHIADGIYSWNFFTGEFCQEIINATNAVGAWSPGKDNHIDDRLGENYYENVPTVDTQLFQISFDKQWEIIVEKYIAPMARYFYNNYKTRNINLAFVVKYDLENQKLLEPHHDSSTYTVNISLNAGNGVDYNGGGCRFIRQNISLVNQPIGSCCIHPGRLTAYHEGLPVTDGTRYILVSFIN